MGWVWSDDKPDDRDSTAIDVSRYKNPSPRSSDGRCSTRKVVRTQCRTEEVEHGKFLRKCEKTEQVLKDCVGRPVEVVQSEKEYTEEDVTDQVLKGSLGSSDQAPFDFPGLRSDMEAIERSFLSGLNNFFEAAEEMKNGFFHVFTDPRVFDGESSSSPSMRRGVPFNDQPKPNKVFPKPHEPSSGQVDLSGLARDV